MNPTDLQVEIADDDSSWFGNNMRWIPASASALEDAERKILSSLETHYAGRYVNIGHHVGDEENKIWTLSLNEKSKKTPLVLIHGFGFGVPMWIANLDALAKNRPLYAIDFLGFGRSSRPTFSKAPNEAEDQLVEAIEKWRRRMNLGKFILVGHSMGGFISASYALRYPERVHHVILVDPWGFHEHVLPNQRVVKFTTLVKLLGPLLQQVNALSFLRIAGPLGPAIIGRLKPTIKRKFNSITDPDIQNALVTYIYHNNASTPSGEVAFKSLSEGFGWARFPMAKRFEKLSTDVRASFVCGSESWIDHQPVQELHQKNPQQFSYCSISGGSHEVFADHAAIFNSLVERICKGVDAAAMNSLQSINK